MSTFLPFTMKWRCRTNIIVTDAAFGGYYLAVGRVIIREFRIMRRQIDRMLLGAKIGAFPPCFGFRAHFCKRRGADEPVKNQHTFIVKRGVACDAKGSLAQRMVIKINDVLDAHEPIPDH